MDDIASSLARQYKLSRQTAIMLALLVKSPHVSSTMMMNKFGDIDHKALVSRLRARLRNADEDIVVRNIYHLGYYLDENVRIKLLATMGGEFRL